MAARPRGGEWLEDELAAWKQAGVSTVFSLLTHEEEEELDLADEASQAKAHSIKFMSFPIADRRVPASQSALTKALSKLDSELVAGRNVVLHCRQGIGRTGLVAACLLLTKGIEADEAVKRVSEARGVAVPETAEQRRWIDRYATAFASANR